MGETKAAEATAQKEYDTFMTDSKVDRHRAQDCEEAGRISGFDREKGRPRGYTEGARCGTRVLRQAEAVLRRCRSELRRPCREAQGGNRVFAGSFEDPQR